MPVSETVRTGAWSTHRADIERRLVEAYMDLLETGTPHGVSMPAVAERAGVSVRTLYRYFPNKDDLQRAAAGWFEQRTKDAMAEPTIDALERPRVPAPALDGPGRPPARGPGAAHHPRRPGAAGGATARPSRAQVDRALSDSVTGARRQEIIDLVIAVTSSSMFLELVDRMGHEPTRAAELAADLIELIVANETGPPGRRTRGRTNGP